MRQEQLDLVLGTQPSRRVVYPYFKDRYAIALLRYVVGDGATIKELRTSRFGRLLDKPFVSTRLSRLGHGRIEPDWLDSQWPAEVCSYVLTLDEWGEDDKHPEDWQTTRTGKNLVLQINFTASHERRYMELIRPDDVHPFVSCAHPTHGGKLRTLSWARIDFELDDGEAVIEEIQTDWLRDARDAYEWCVRGKREHRRWFFRDGEFDRARLRTYYEQVLRPHRAMWDELTLLAAIQFIRDQLGIRRIFYHSYWSGNFMKDMSSWFGPPKSLYTTLPRKFCFRFDFEVPRFVKRAWAESYRPRVMSKRRARWFDWRDTRRKRVGFYILDLD